MKPLYYKYIDPIIDYLQPFPKIISDPVVLIVLGAFIIASIVWALLFIKQCKE